MDVRAFLRMVPCIGVVPVLAGCPNAAETVGGGPIAAASSIPVAARSARGADFPPPPAHPAGPHTATGVNPFLPAPTAEPTAPPFVPDPPPVPVEPPASSPTAHPQGTPL